MSRKGRPNVKQVIVWEPSQCPSCGSSDRAEYEGVRRTPCSKTLADGRVVTAILRRRTKCLSCGQIRIDRSFEFGKRAV